MVKKKKHHYIPKFYLKRFSNNNDGKFVGLYNLKNGKFISHAPLKSQGAEDFLYGVDDEIENALARMENDMARIFYFWTEKKWLDVPPVESNGFKLLKRFILYQAYRTPKSGEDLMDSVNQTLKTFIKKFEPDFWEKAKDGNFDHEDPVLLSLLNSIQYEHLLDYLDCRFIVNLSLLPFVTSDAPVIFYNQLMEKAGSYVGATGLPAKGFQVFYPIHPRLMICLYDPIVYEFADGAINCGSTDSVAEIHQLNALQLINCKSQLFFNDFIPEDYIGELIKGYSHYRGKEKKINQAIDYGSRKFFYMGSEDVTIDLDLHFLKMKVNPDDYSRVTAPVRHPSFERPIKVISLKD